MTEDPRTLIEQLIRRLPELEIDAASSNNPEAHAAVLDEIVRTIVDAVESGALTVTEATEIYKGSLTNIYQERN